MSGSHPMTGIKEVVAVTFTDKAAGELRLRLRSELEKKRQQEREGSPRYINLLDALAQLEEAQVNTIHGFCADILRERPVEAMLDPQFESMNESQAKQLQREAFKLWLQRVLKDPPEGVRRFLRRDVRRGPADSLYEAASKLAMWCDYPAPWRRPEFDRVTAIDSLVGQLQKFAQLTSVNSDATDRLYLSTLPARRLADQITAWEAVATRDYDALEAQLVGLYRDRRFREPQKGRTKKYGDTVLRAEVLKAHEELVTALEDFTGKANADLAALLHAELQEALSLYEEWKLRLGRLDFLDLLVRARNLLRDNHSARADLQGRFTHIFVDEFQDTDPVQAEILLLLSCGNPRVSDWRKAVPEPGKLFIVGDPKQAVYRFRRADVGVYQDVKNLLEAHGALCINLTTSFRGKPALQNVVNAAFQPIMKKDAVTLQASYVPLSPYRQDMTEQPTIVALPVTFQSNISFDKTRLVTESAEELGVPAIVRQRLDAGQFRLGIIGLNDDTMDDLVPGGSVVVIDKSHNTVEMRDWKTIQERPIYFVWHDAGYSCSWCNVVRDTLFIVPYPTSRRPVMIFKMPRAATVIGRIIHVWPPLIIERTPA